MWTWRHTVLALLALAIPVAVVLWPTQARAAEADAGMRSAFANHRENAAHFVPVDPAVLAQAAGVSIEIYALASMAASEAGGENRQSQIAVMWAAKNHARARGESISRLLLRCGHNAVKGDPKSFQPYDGNGFFGRGHRYAVTHRPPTAQGLADAKEVFAGVTPDLTGGATRFDTADPALEDVEQVTANRQAAGLEAYGIEGVDGFRFWRKATNVDVAAAENEGPT